jgi:hypothetical protein
MLNEHDVVAVFIVCVFASIIYFLKNMEKIK